MSQDNPEKMETLAKKIWLAGLGAYGRSLDGVQMSYDKISEESQKIFEELVAKGEHLQKETASKVKKSNHRLEARADDIKKKLSLTNGLNKKLDEMSKKIDQLAKELNKT